MDRTTRLRRVGLLCCHFARNLAYYKSGWGNGDLKVKEQFWVSINSNFLDMAVLEWCKLFGDYKDKHHWKNITHTDSKFKERMFEELKIKQTDLDLIHGSIKSYRDKFVAHLDSELTMKIPKISEGLEMVCFYYKEVKSLCDKTSDWPESLESFYKEHYEKGLAQYGS
jgi:hypothetical protein